MPEQQACESCRSWTRNEGSATIGRCRQWLCTVPLDYHCSLWKGKEVGDA